MKLATFEDPTSATCETRIGIVDDSSYIDVTAGYARVLADDGDSQPSQVASAVAPADMLDFLRGGERSLEAAQTVLEAEPEADVTSPSGRRIRWPRDEMRLRSPLPRPNTIRDFSVFEEHGREDKPDVWYEFPSPYKGNPETVVPPNATVEWPSYDDKPDFELEIAAVIGRRGQNIPADEAGDYIAGYMIFNDFSARDIQFREMQAHLGPAKGKDFANGFGPYLVTADAFDPVDSTARVHVNSEQWVEADVGAMYHSFADIIEHTSKAEPVVPGDILGSGTVAGCCCLDLDRWIEYGDTITLEVDGLGELTHQIIKQ